MRHAPAVARPSQTDRPEWAVAPRLPPPSGRRPRPRAALLPGPGAAPVRPENEGALGMGERGEGGGGGSSSRPSGRPARGL